MVHRYALAKGSELVDDEKGDLVAYVYYQELEAERDSVVAQLKAERDTLAADNAALHLLAEQLERDLQAAIAERDRYAEAIRTAAATLPPPEKEPLEQLVEEFIEKVKGDGSGRSQPTAGARSSS